MHGINIRKINPLSGMGGREFIGVDFNSNTLKVAHLRPGYNKMEIAHLFSWDISGFSDEDISKLLRTAFSDLKLKKPCIINIVPSNLVITKNIEIPSSDSQEIKEIINLQAGRHTPYSREEIIVDYIDIGTYKHKYSKVLLVIVTRGAIKRQFDILTKAGFGLDNILFAPEGLVWFVSKILRLETAVSPRSIVHIDESVTDFVVIFNDRPVFVRSIPIGSQHLINERDRYEAKFIEELKRSLEAYQSESIEKNPDMVVLSGAVEEIKNLDVALNKGLHLPVNVEQYYKHFSIAGDVLKKASTDKHLSFLNVIASILGRENIKVNLMPEEARLNKSVEERGRDLIMAGILVLTLFVLVCFILVSKIYFKNSYLARLSVKEQELSKEAGVLEKNFTEIGLVRKYLSGRGYSLEVLNELYSLISLDIEAGDIKFDDQGRFSVRGVANSMSAVFSFVDRMEKSKYFKDVKTKYTTKRKEEGRDVTDFEIIAALEKEKEQ
jgi:Tfp pilus assembly PilM family ATPase